MFAMDRRTIMKRYHITSKFRFITFLTILILFSAIVIGSFFGFFDASSMGGKYYTTVKVQFGDTLWDLANEHGPADADCRQVIYEICMLNDISADTLQAGQKILIPTSI